MKIMVTVQILFNTLQFTYIILYTEVKTGLKTQVEKCTQPTNNKNVFTFSFSQIYHVFYLLLRTGEL